MTSLRKMRIFAAVGSFILGISSAASAQNNAGQSTVNGAQTNRPYSSQTGMQTRNPLPSSAGTQSNGSPQIQPNIPISPASVPPDLLPPIDMERDQSRMRNVDRQKQLESDTQKLLALATELKTDVDKSNKDMMSLDVIRKAEAIEKLAHSVKEKMKGS